MERPLKGVSVKYLADVLTATRVVLAFVGGWAILTHQWPLALVAIAIAALTDAADGYCARRWPYSAADELRLPWRHIDHHTLDNAPDLILQVVTMACLAIVFPYWWWVNAVFYGIGVLFFVSVELLVRRGHVRAAEVTDVVFGWWYALGLVAVILELTFRAGWPWLALVLELIAVILVVIFKWDRATTRPETRVRAEGYAAQRS